MKVTRLRIHPVKGARGCDVDALDFDALGPRGDRRWMVIRPNGHFVSQREMPLLASVRPTLAGGSLRLEGPGVDAVVVPVSGTGGDLIDVRVWSSAVRVRAPSPEADAWLSSLLGTPLRLVHMADTDVREADPEYARGQRISFADGYPALLVGQGSVDELERRTRRTIPVERFRPNIVVSTDRPHDEDFWQTFTIGDVRFRGVKLCARCVVTTIDQDTGARDANREPLRTLARYRRIESLVYFGLNAVHREHGQVRLGDAVELHERGIVRGAV